MMFPRFRSEIILVACTFAVDVRHKFASRLPRPPGLRPLAQTPALLRCFRCARPMRCTLKPKPCPRGGAYATRKNELCRRSRNPHPERASILSSRVASCGVVRTAHRA